MNIPTYDFNQIYSVTALRVTAQHFRDMAKCYEYHADDLERKRNYISAGKDDIGAYAKAMKYMLHHPDFPNLTATQLHTIADMFYLTNGAFERFGGERQAAHRAEKARQRARTARILKSKGFKNKEIAKRIGLTAGRVSQILATAPL